MVWSSEASGCNANCTPRQPPTATSCPPRGSIYCSEEADVDDDDGGGGGGNHDVEGVDSGDDDGGDDDVDEDEDVGDEETDGM